MGTRLTFGSTEADAGNPFPVVLPTVTTLPFRRIATADTNLATVKAASGKLYSLNMTNVSAGTKYLKIYNKGANPVLASDVPVVTIPVVASGSVNHTFAGDLGLTCSAGIAIAITGAIADTDATALVASDVILTIIYS